MISWATKPVADTISFSPGTAVEGVVVTVRVPMACRLADPTAYGTVSVARKSAAVRMGLFHAPLIIVTCRALLSPHPVGQREADRCAPTIVGRTSMMGRADATDRQPLISDSLSPRENADNIARGVHLVVPCQQQQPESGKI